MDLGTSAVKLLLMEGTGKIQKIVSKEYPIEFPKPGWSQQNPGDWWAATVAGIRELTRDCDRSQVAGISFGGQMHGLVILDEKDAVIRPAILWNDGRTVKEVEYLNEVIGRETLSKYTANIAFAGFTAPKLLWVREHEPENFARIAKIMLPKDYIAYKMTGVHCTDVSDASGMLLLDVKNRCWSDEMIEICHIRKDQLPHGLIQRQVNRLEGRITVHLPAVIDRLCILIVKVDFEDNIRVISVRISGIVHSHIAQETGVALPLDVVDDSGLRMGSDSLLIENRMSVASGQSDLEALRRSVPPYLAVSCLCALPLKIRQICHVVPIAFCVLRAGGNPGGVPAVVPAAAFHPHLGNHGQWAGCGVRGKCGETVQQRNPFFQ